MLASLKFLKCFVVLTLWKQRETLLDIIICNTNPNNKQLYYSLIILFHISEENQIYEYVQCIICCRYWWLLHMVFKNLYEDIHVISHKTNCALF